MSAAPATRLRLPARIGAASALLSLGLHLGILGVAVDWGRSAPAVSAAGRPSDDPVSLPVDLSGQPNQAAPEEFVDVALAPQQLPSGPNLAAPDGPTASATKPAAAAAKPVAKPAAAKPAPKSERATARAAALAEPEGEDWLGVNRASVGEQPASSAGAPPTKSHHEALMERLLAAEQRKAAARAAIEPPETSDGQTEPPRGVAALASGTSAPPVLAADATASPTARRIQAANSLSQAAAWTIPYACATDPIWERSSSVGGQVQLHVELSDGRVTSTRLQGDTPAHLKKLADGVSFYLKQGYRARDGLAHDGAYVLQISVHTSEGPKNQSLGFDQDRARSHFTLISGRRVDAEVSERQPARR